MHVAELLRRHALGRPDLPALTCPERTVSWRELLDRSSALAHGLDRAGIRPGDRVAILGLACHRYWEAHFACAVGGFVAVPVNHRLAEPEVAGILIDADCRAVVAGGPFGVMATGLRTPAVTTVLGWGEGHGTRDVEEVIATSDPAWRGPEVDASDINVLAYTSGTTGRPKAAAVSHHTATTAALCYAAHWELRPGDSVLCCNPPYVFRGGPGLLAALSVGGHVVTMPFDGGAVAEAMERHRCRAVTMAPAMASRFLDAVEAGPWDVSSLRTFLVSGAPPTPTFLRRILDVLGDVVAVQYGMTEATGIAMGRLRPDDLKSDAAVLRSAGRPLPLVDVQIVDDEGQLVVAGDVGEIEVRGDGVMLGYWEEGRVSRRCFRDGWFPTGDVGRVDVEGNLYLTDRRADIINSGGFNVYSLEVENTIAAVPGVVACTVVGAPDPRWGEAVTAVVVATPGVTELDIVDACRARLADFKCPRRVDFVEVLPHNAMGKVDKRAVRSRYWSGDRSIAG